MCLKRLLLLLILLLLAVCAGRSHALAADRPVLTVWTSVPAPGSQQSWCGHCDRFWEDFRTVPGFAAALKSRYTVVWRDFERFRPAAAIVGITSIPAFTAPGQRIIGYTSPADLLSRLGIAPLRGSVPLRGSANPQPEAPAQQNEPAQEDQPAKQDKPAKPDPQRDSLEARIEEWRQSTEQVLNAHQRDNDSRLAGMEQQLQQQATAGDERLTRIEQALLAQQKAAAEQQSQLQQTLGSIRQQLEQTREAGGPAQPVGEAVTDLTGSTDLPQAGGQPAGSAAKTDTPGQGTPPQGNEPAQPDGHSIDGNQPVRRNSPGWSIDLPGLAGLLLEPVALAVGGPLAATAVGGVIWYWRRRRQPKATPPTAPPAPDPSSGTIGESLQVQLGRILARLETLQRGKGGEAEPGIPPGPARDTDSDETEPPIIPPRATEELHQLLQLRRREGRDPLLDAAFGMFIQDEIEKALSAEGLSENDRETLYQLNRRVRDRVDQAAPLMVTAED